MQYCRENKNISSLCYQSFCVYRLRSSKILSLISNYLKNVFHTRIIFLEEDEKLCPRLSLFFMPHVRCKINDLDVLVGAKKCWCCCEVISMYSLNSLTPEGLSFKCRNNSYNMVLPVSHLILLLAIAISFLANFLLLFSG